MCFGKPCIRGTRIGVSLILDNLAAGVSEQELLEEYPQLTPEDIRAAIAYGAEMARERFVEIPLEKHGWGSSWMRTSVGSSPRPFARPDITSQRGRTTASHLVADGT